MKDMESEYFYAASDAGDDADSIVSFGDDFDIAVDLPIATQAYDDAIDNETLAYLLSNQTYGDA